MKARCLAEGGAYREFRSLRKPLTACLCMAVPVRAEGPRFSPRSLLGRPTSDGPLTERHHRAQASVVEISQRMRATRSNPVSDEALSRHRRRRRRPCRISNRGRNTLSTPLPRILGCSPTAPAIASRCGWRSRAYQSSPSPRSRPAKAEIEASGPSAMDTTNAMVSSVGPCEN